MAPPKALAGVVRIIFSIAVGVVLPVDGYPGGRACLCGEGGTSDEQIPEPSRCREASMGQQSMIPESDPHGRHGIQCQRNGQCGPRKVKGSEGRPEMDYR